MARTVSSPDGNRWYVRRVWLPWRPTWRRRRKKVRLDTDHPLEDAVGCVLDIETALIGVALLLAAYFVWPVLVALAELVLLALLGMLARVLLRRPWIVEATPATGRGRFRWKVVGWRRSGEVVDAVAERLSSGDRSVSVPGAEPC